MKRWGRRTSWPWEGIVHALVNADYGFAPNFAKTQRFLDAIAPSPFSLGACSWR
jgi:hypothetical protein